MSGAVLPPQVPLCDTHNRESTAKVLGSVRDLRVEGDSLVGRLFVASSEYGVWSKIRDKHLTDVSWGVQPLETVEIKPGKTQEIQGRSFTAPADRSLFVHASWRLREVSVTPIGSDDRAKIRSLFLPGTHAMTELIRKWLEENFKLRAEATAEEAQTLWDGLADADRARAEEACREADDADDDDEDDDEDDDDDKPEAGKKSMHRVTRSSVVTEETRAAEEAERIRAASQEAAEKATAAERKRVATIKRLAGTEVPARARHPRDQRGLEDWPLQDGGHRARPPGPHRQRGRRRQHRPGGDGPYALRRGAGRARPQPRGRLHRRQPLGGDAGPRLHRPPRPLRHPRRLPRQRPDGRRAERPGGKRPVPHGPQRHHPHALRPGLPRQRRNAAGPRSGSWTWATATAA